MDAFRALGVKPMLGRGFEEGDDAPGANVVLLGHELWRDRYGSAPTSSAGRFAPTPRR